MKNKLFVFSLIVALIMSLGLVTAANPLEDFFDEFEHQSGKIYSMVDEDGNVVMRTARQIVVGDEYINMANNYYRVVSVDGETAVARIIERERATSKPEPQQETFLMRVDRLLRNAIPVQQQNEETTRRIAVYNSHGAESYIEGDGTESKDPGGGILDVGDRFAQALEEKGIEVVRSREPHTPHDAGAYQRSRRTAEEAIKKQPDALIDVHRDAVPEEEYLEEVEGEQRVQVQLVVGRQNQNMEANRQFAEELKAAADEKYPGLVKGIFMARGNYNQDMSPRSALIEVGSHTNDKAQAEESVELFAEVLSDFLYGPGDGDAAAPPTEAADGTAWRSILWVILGLVVVIVAFLLISTGGFDQMKSKVRNFTNKEFTSTLGLPEEEDNQDNEDKEPPDNGGSKEN